MLVMSMWSKASRANDFEDALVTKSDLLLMFVRTLGTKNSMLQERRQHPVPMFSFFFLAFSTAREVLAGFCAGECNGLIVA